MEIVLHNYFQHTEARGGVRQGFPQHEPEAEWALNIWTECVLQDRSNAFNVNRRLDTTEFCCQNIWKIGLKNVYQSPSV